MSKSLAATGLKGDALTAALESSAIKAAKLKFGPDFAKEMLSIDRQSTKLKANFAGLFGGLQIESLLEGLSTVVDLFGKNTASGQAIKVVFESIFQPLIDGIVAFIPKFVSGFIEFEIAAMKAMISLKLAVKDAMPTLKKIGTAAEEAFAIIVAVSSTVGTALYEVGAVLFQVAAAVFYTSVAFQAWRDSVISGVVGAVVAVKTALTDAIAWMKAIDLSEVGASIVEGLANGISAAAEKVTKAARGVAGKAVQAVQSALDINSPSKVFQAIGMYTGEGMALGIDDASGDVETSMAKMVDPQSVLNGTQGAGAKSGASAQGASGANFSGATFNFSFAGVAGAEEVEAKIVSVVTRLIEGDLTRLGEEVPA